MRDKNNEYDTRTRPAAAAAARHGIPGV